jgi:hypothetical protein
MQRRPGKLLRGLLNQEVALTWTSLVRMQADADLLASGLVGLTDDELPSPLADLPGLVREKPLPRKTVQMGASINGFLRRSVRPKVETPSHSVEPTSHSTSQATSAWSSEEQTGDRNVTNLDGDESVLGDIIQAQTDRVASGLDTSTIPDTPPNSHSVVNDEDVPDHFKMLGVGMEADQDEVRKAYKRLLLQVRAIFLRFPSRSHSYFRTGTSRQTRSNQRSH